MPAAAIAGLFPGQGSHTGDLRAHVQRAAPDLMQHAARLLGEDPFARVGESTRFAQPAIYCASIAGWRAFQHGDAAAAAGVVAVAGHSLGELSALSAAGAIDQLCGLELAVLRGELMATAAARGEPQGMVAVLGGSPELPAELAASYELSLANDNAPGQVVLAGSIAQMREATLAARAAGARAIRLEVTGAFHSPAMTDAVQPFRAALRRVQISTPAIPVLSSVTAEQFNDVPAELAAAITLPVRWRETMAALAALGADTFIDLGPGDVLARLVARNLPNATIHPPTRPRPAQEPSGVR